MFLSISPSKRREDTDSLNLVFSFYRTVLFIVVAILSITGAVFFSTTQEVYANSSTSPLSKLDKEIKTSLLRNALAVCTTNAPLSGGGGIDQNKRINEDAAQRLEWWGGNGTNNLDIIVGVVLNSKYSIPGVSRSGVASCSDTAFVRAALTELGYGDKLSGLDNVNSLMCELGFRRYSSPSSTTSVNDCKKSTGDWRRAEVNRDDNSWETKALLRDTFLEKLNPNVKELSKASTYLIIESAVKSLCSPDGGQLGQSSSVDGKYAGILKEIRGDVLYTWGENRKSFVIGINSGEGYSAGLLERDGQVLPGVNIDGGVRLNNTVLPKGYVYEFWGMGSKNPCTTLASQANLFFKDYKDFYDRLSDEDKAAVDADTDRDNTEGEDQTSCRIEGIGWLLCPVLNFVAGVTDASYAGVKLLLETPAMFTTGSGGNDGVYIAWQAMRSIANVAFVIIFIIIIFSQISGFGISNYGVKKQLPRLVVAAILVNVSFFICALAVDLSNIIGSGMSGFFDSIGAELKAPAIKDAGEWSSVATGEGWVAIVGAIIAGGALAAGLLYVGLSAVIPFLLAAVIAILTVFIVLTLRQALIILLVVISPLAFVAYLLPNTENLFTAWRKMLTTLLLMFPVIAVIFGASALAGQVVMNTSDNILVQTAGAAMTIIPLAITPIVMRSAGGVLNRVGAFVNNPNRGPIDSLRKRAGDFRDRRQNDRKGRALTGTGRNVFGGGRFRREHRRNLKNEAASSFADVGKNAFDLTDNKSAALAGQVATNNLASSALSSAKSAAMASGIANQNVSLGSAMGGAAAGAASAAIAATVAKAIAEEISNAKLSAEIKAGDIDGMKRAFEDAVKSGDSIKARAMQEMLMSSGGKGMSSWRDSVSDMEKSGSIDNEMSGTLRDHAMKSNPGLKSSDNAAATWATKTAGSAGSAFDDIKKDPKTWNSLSNEELLSQKESALKDALKANSGSGGGFIDRSRARAISESDIFKDKVSESIKSDIRSLI